MSNIVYLAGSFKHWKKMQEINLRLKHAGTETLISQPDNPEGIDGCFSRIQQADYLYVLNFDGYVGKSVAMDIGFALGLGKKVYALEPIDDPDITHLLNGVLSPDEAMIQWGRHAV